MAAAAACATGSITPGLGSTWTTRHAAASPPLPATGGSMSSMVAHLGRSRPFHHAVDQQFAGDAVDLSFVESRLGSDSRGRRHDARVHRQAQFGGASASGARRLGRAAPRQGRCQLPTASRMRLACLGVVPSSCVAVLRRAARHSPSRFSNWSSDFKHVVAVGQQRSAATAPGRPPRSALYPAIRPP